MKQLLFISFLVISLPVFSQQISNAGLEHWQISPTIQQPDSFWTNDEFIPLGLVTRTTDAHSGQYAMLLSSLTAPFGPYAGIAGYGTIPPGSANLGWPFSARPSHFKCWYKYNRQGNDTGFISLQLTKWMNGGTNIIGLATVLFTSTTSVYTEADMQVFYFQPDQPDTLILVVSSGSATPTIGTQLFIDDISLVYTTGVDGYEYEQGAMMYPNPASDIVHIEIPGDRRSDIEISNVTGQKVFQQNAVSPKFQLSCVDWPSGIYFWKIRQGENIFTGKLIKQ